MTVLRAHPDDDDLRSTLLRACSVDIAYDPQCEGSRADYLHRLVAAAGQGRSVFQALSGSLREARSADVDVVQTFEVLCLLAAEDPGLDREGLRDFLIASPFDIVAYGCMDALVRLDGVDAISRCVRRFAADLRDDDGRVLQSMIEALTARDGAKAVGAALDRARRACTDLDALMKIDEEQAASTPRIATPLDSASVLAGVAAGRPVPLTWMKAATSDDLTRVAEGLVTARDDAAITRHLRVFSHRDFPGDLAILIDLARSTNAQIGHLAARALRRFDHPAVRALALSYLAEGRHFDRAVSLLRSTYRTGDLVGLADALGVSALDDDASHRVGCAIIDLLDHAAVLAMEARGLLLWVYENGPCSICRARAVERLAASRELPVWMIEECRFDADPETVRLASEQLGRRR